MARNILVYPHEGIFTKGYQCAHAVVDPNKDGDIVLCMECSDAVDNGANIEKQKAKEALKK